MVVLQKLVPVMDAMVEDAAGKAAWVKPNATDAQSPIVLMMPRLMKWSQVVTDYYEGDAGDGGGDYDKLWKLAWPAMKKILMKQNKPELAKKLARSS